MPTNRMFKNQSIDSFFLAEKMELEIRVIDFNSQIRRHVWIQTQSNIILSLDYEKMSKFLDVPILGSNTNTKQMIQ